MPQFSSNRTSTGTFLGPVHGALLVVDIMLLVGLLVFAVWTYGSLPDRYPIHFGVTGHPDRWANGDSLEWFVGPIIAVLLNGVLVAVTLFMPRIPPAYINVPHKTLFLSLTPNQQQQILRSSAGLILCVTLFANLTFFSVQVMVLMIAQGRLAAPNFLCPVSTMLLLAAIVTLWLFRIRRMVRELAYGPQPTGHAV